MAAIPEPHVQPHLSRGRIAECHRRAGFGFHRPADGALGPKSPH
jgi:hypothetical protein